MDALGINLPGLITQIVSFGILFFILSKLLYKPLVSMLDQRAEKISEGLNPQRSIYLCLKDERRIPLTQVQQPKSISSLEEQAADLAKFLDLKLENL